MHKALGVQVTASQILHGQRQALAVLDLIIRRERFDVHCLNVIMLGPDDLSALIHRRHRIFTADLEHHCALIIAN